MLAHNPWPSDETDLLLEMMVLDVPRRDLEEIEAKVKKASCRSISVSSMDLKILLEKS